MKIQRIKKDYDEVMAVPRYKHKPPKKVALFWRVLIRILTVFGMAGTKFTYESERMELLGKDEPCLILMNHSSFADMEISVNGGNVIFPEGNALKYLAEYFTDELPENPYKEDPRDVRCVSFEPNGNVLGSNVYGCDIMKIIKDYAP